MTEPLCKVAFELEQDADGYPPVSVETLWASQVGLDSYCLDNIPFYARGVSSGDVVRTQLKSGSNVFDEVLQPSTNSVFRIYVSNESDLPEARAFFKELGCESELSNIPKLFAVEIPGDIDFARVGILLIEGLDSNRWEYEEACLRHQPTAQYLQRTKTKANEES